MGELPDQARQELASIRKTLRELESRVEALEHGAPASGEEIRTVEPALTASSPEAFLAEVGTDQIIPLFGWAFLGLAGAYLLRAASEAGVLPGIGGAVAGIAYAGWWLFLAARAPAGKPLFSTVHGLTAALILTPLLWETTVRFGVISTAAASTVICGFAVWGLAIAWKRNITSIAWIVTVAGLLTVTALFREKHDAAAWLASVLFITIVVEFSACRDHWLSLRWMTAAAADLTVLLCTMFLTSFTTPPIWAPSALLVLAAQIALLTIYLGSTVDRTILRGLSITGFEMGQLAVAFTVSIGGALYMARANATGSLAIGLFCLLGGLACYLLSFAFLEHRSNQGRNFHTYSTFAILLTSSGFLTMFSSTTLAAGWSCLSVAMMWIGIRGSRTTLRVHAAVYLLLAVLNAGYLDESWSRIIRVSGQSAPLASTYYVTCLGVIAVYAVIVKLEGERLPHWTDRIESTATSALTLLGVVTLSSEWLQLVPVANAPLRTGFMLAAVLGLVSAAGRWRRAEWAWLSFPLLGLAGYKLIREEFQYGTSANLMVSLILFGATLILLPRVRRGGSSRPQAVTPAVEQTQSDR